MLPFCPEIPSGFKSPTKLRIWQSFLGGTLSISPKYRKGGAPHPWIFWGSRGGSREERGAERLGGLFGAWPTADF